MTHPLETLMEIFEIRDYEDRLARIGAHLGRIDDAFFDVIDRAVEEIEPPDVRIELAVMRAMMLAEVAFVHGRKGDLRAAKKFARRSLLAILSALRSFGKTGLASPGRAENLLDVVLADAGEFRRLGLEEAAWQAYWIADPILAAKEAAAERGDRVAPGRLLAAALTLERVGMRERAEEAMAKAREKIPDARLFENEKALAARLAEPLPADVPPPEIYRGDSTETAYRFASSQVGTTSIHQTPCPRCRSEMSFAGSTILASANLGKAYSQVMLVCKADKSHPAVTLYLDLSGQSGGAVLGGAGRELKRLEEQKLAKKT